MSQKVRCFQTLDGNIKVVHPNYVLKQDNETDETFLARIGAHAAANDPSLGGLPFVDIERSMILALDRSQRHKWRIVGNQVRVDPTVPDRPHPQQARLDAINAATTVDQLKAELAKFIKGE